MTPQEFSDQLSIHLAKKGARVKVQLSHSSSVYLRAKYRGVCHAIRVSDHAPGKRWQSGLGATNVDTRRDRMEAIVIRVSACLGL